MTVFVGESREIPLVMVVDTVGVGVTVVVVDAGCGGTMEKVTAAPKFVRVLTPVCRTKRVKPFWSTETVEVNCENDTV